MCKTILLADDHILFRDTLAQHINASKDFKVISVAADGAEVVETIQNGTIPEMVVLDLNMPKMDGFETARWIRLHHPEMKIVILTMYDSEVAFVRLLETGVQAFLRKDINPVELTTAFHAVLENGHYYSHETTAKLGSLFKRNNGINGTLEKIFLNATEIAFLKLACTELTYKEIAAEMKSTPRIVDSYRDLLFEKLNVKSRVGLALYAIKNGLVTSF